jgi:DNA-binding LacI/PurR family transcriptional regulator
MATLRAKGRTHGRRIQQRQIAERAGVSISTVSRVLNNVSGISDAVRHRVYLAANELGQDAVAMPEPTGARHLSLFAPAQDPTRDPFNADIASGIEEECRRLGIHLSYATLGHHTPDDLQLLDRAFAHGVDGTLTVSLDDQKLIAAIMARNVPLVLINSEYPELPVDTYLPDNQIGPLLAMRHLIAHGHRRILFLTHFQRVTIQRRYEAYRRALDEAGIPFDPDLVIDVEMLAEPAHQAMRQILAQGRPSFTAVFCANDVTAIGALRAMHEAGLQIPRDVSIVGYDDLPMTAFLSPPLTTVRIERKELGARAVRGLLDRMASPHQTPVRVELASRLIQRESVGPAPA